MKTSEAHEVRSVDNRAPVESHKRAQSPAAPSSIGRVLRRAAIAVLVLLIIAVVTVVARTDTAVEQPAMQWGALLDRSIRARDALDAPEQDTVLNRSIRARDALDAPEQDTVLNRSIRARDALDAPEQDTVLNRSIRARER